MNKEKEFLLQIKKFIVEANKKGYAAGGAARIKKEKDHSKTISYVRGDWKYHDNYFGGEPYGGREVVFFKGKPVWMMTYYGWVNGGVELEPVYSFLQEALRAIPENNPYRGPKLHENDSVNMIYHNIWGGDAAQFSGEERIMQGKKEVYRAMYMGGLVDVVRQ
ncbi:MAG: DUF5680 domain-containing protein [Candidatus Paceibacterota bacterium]|jgi:hypothetical protein